MTQSTTRKTIGQHAYDVLRETDNPAVGYGDSGLLDEIADRAGVSSKGRYMDGHPYNRWAKVLAGLERSNLFEKQYFTHRGRLCRVFVLKGA